jgi:(p)ppGpp synthase/HD superfamily hydrolase
MQLFLRIPRVAEAFELCVAAHREQYYGLLPYFTHPLQVAETLFDLPGEPTEDELIAALLHDVPEDTAYNVKDVGERFGDGVETIVGLVTKDDTLTYDQNIMRIVHRGNRSAVRVKWSDNRVNMGNDKSHMDAKRRERLNGKYAKSFLTLSSVLGV